MWRALYKTECGGHYIELNLEGIKWNLCKEIAPTVGK